MNIANSGTAGPKRYARGVAAAVALVGAAWTTSVTAADPGSGNRIYFTRCVGCHGVAGKAANPGAPNLVGNDKVLQPDVVLLTRIKTGKNQCPPFLGVLSDKELLDLIAYLRTLR